VLATQSNVAHELLEKISEARRLSDALFDIVRPEALYDRPIPERHRILFYVGHLEAFDWNLLHESLRSQRTNDAGFDRLFAFGIDPVNGGLPDDQPSDWPRLPEVHDYVAQTRAALDEKLAESDLESTASVRDGFPLFTLLNVAVEHRLMHLETLAYMLHQMPLDRKIPQKSSHDVSNSPVVSRMIEIPAGTATLGLSRSSRDFGWDNEYAMHTRSVPAFEIDQYKVTNRQYLEFMEAGGYERRDLWSGDAWEWKNKQGISHPAFWAAFWKKTGDRWIYRAMFEETPLPLDWPVYVSHAEAMAYARWAGKSLPTEEEWHRAAFGTPHGAERFYPWGNQAPTSEFGNFDFARWDPMPVNAHPLGASAFGVQGMLGNGWEWTSTVFGPFPGFEAFPFYRGYSADFFDGKHFVMKGASARTAASMLRPTFRNWFQAHYQYMYAGFRCVSR
jgi:gamma-glutamyl hercynylcysteine S-oxide synthase